eukprot:1144154-Amphidinium_carterae.1
MQLKLNDQRDSSSLSARLKKREHEYVRTHVLCGVVSQGSEGEHDAVVLGGLLAGRKSTSASAQCGVMQN